VATTTETLQIEGIFCERCVQKIAAALGAVDGLAGASLTLAGDLTLAYDAAETRAAAVAAVEGAGFAVAGA
jgi:copper chaperone CopZ